MTCSKLPYFGIEPKPPKNKYKDKNGIRYFIARLDDRLNPNLSSEDLHAVKDYPAIYIYVSDNENENNRVFYIGQSINIENRVNDHRTKLNNSKYKKFKRFKGGLYFVFYSNEISNNLNLIEEIMIMQFVKEFNIFNYTDLEKSKDGDGSISSKLANRDYGNDSGKYQDLRENIYNSVVKHILKVLYENGIISQKNFISKNYMCLFRDTPFFKLTKNQIKIFNSIMDKLNHDLGHTYIHGIKGPAGTGKTVLILHIIGSYINEYNDSRIAVYLRKTQRRRFEKILKAYGIDLKTSNLTIGTFKQIVDEISSKGKFDLIIVDEAQRTTKLHKKDGFLLYPTGAKADTDLLNKKGEKSQLSLLYKNTFNMILAYDIEQNLRIVDETEFDKDFNSDNQIKFFSDTNMLKVECFRHALSPQLRIMPKYEKFASMYINFIKNLLGIDKSYDDYSDFVSQNKKYNYIKIASTEREWIEYIDEKQKKFPHKKSVLISGYCKPIKRDEDNENLAEFIKLDSNKIYWSNKQKEFLDYSNNTLKVGNSYDIQGFDIDFAGVYIGKDIIWSNEEKCTITNHKSFYDRGAKKGLSFSEIDPFIRKSYYVLLTRAVHGQIWYIEDIKLSEEIRRRLEI